MMIYCISKAKTSLIHATLQTDTKRPSYQLLALVCLERVGHFREELEGETDARLSVTQPSCLTVTGLATLDSIRPVHAV